MRWTKLTKFFKKSRNCILIEAINEVIERHPNDQHLGSVIRIFHNNLKDIGEFTDDDMYELLLETSKKYNHKP